MKVPTAILDDGLHPGAFALPHLVEEFCIGTEETEKFGMISHGTICAAILHQLAPEMELHSIKVLDQAGKGSLSSLKSALTWCYENRMRLVHLSLGTELYQDFLELEEILQALTANGTILVSAFSNRNVPSYPAFFPGVFGVRHTEENILGADFALCENYWLKATNAWVSKSFKELPCLDGSTFNVPVSNSFAAPVVTAEIYKILSKRPGCLISEIQNILVGKAGELPPGRHAFNSFLWSRERVSSVPIILVTPESAGPVLETVELLRKDGYKVEAFGLKGTVPLSLYTDKGFVSDDLLNGLARIYKADILFVAADMANTSPSVGDAWIEKDSFTVGGFRKRYGSGKELKTKLVEMFTDIAE